MTDQEWTYDWPTEPGWYWYYGDPHSSENKPKHVRMHPVKVAKGQNSMVYVTNNSFIYARVAGLDGLWLPMVIPDLPK